MSKVDLKVVLLGKENGGKTSLVERFIFDRFRGELPYQNTIGAAFAARKMEVNGEQITLGVWDTAGSERYESMSRIYYRDAGAAIVCYDLSDPESFERTKFWVAEIRVHEEKCRIYLCGTKSDLIKVDRKLRKVDYHTTTDFADEVNAVVFETSSKTSEGVFELFNKIAEDYLRNRKDPHVAESIEKLTLVVPSNKRPSTCC